MSDDEVAIRVHRTSVDALKEHALSVYKVKLSSEAAAGMLADACAEHLSERARRMVAEMLRDSESRGA